MDVAHLDFKILTRHFERRFRKRGSCPYETATVKLQTFFNIKGDQKELFAIVEIINHLGNSDTPNTDLIKIPPAFSCPSTFSPSTTGSHSFAGCTIITKSTTSQMRSIISQNTISLMNARHKVESKGTKPKWKLPGPIHSNLSPCQSQSHR